MTHDTIASVRDLPPDRRAEAIFAGSTRVLEAMAAGQPLAAVLETIVRMAEDVEPSLRGAIVLIDPECACLRVGAAPSLPASYRRCADGLAIRPGVGSCTHSAATGHELVVEDTSVHPNWVDLRDLAETVGLRGCWSVPLIAADGTVVGAFGIFFSQPQRPSQAQMALVRAAARMAEVAIARHAESEALRTARHAAEQANAAKSSFLAAMSHDLRTPLNAIIGFSDMLLAHLPGQEGARRDEYIADIRTAGHHLLDLLNDILDLAKIDAGRMDLAEDVVDPDSVAQAMVAMMQARIADHGLSCAHSPLPPRAFSLRADKMKLRQMLLNLLSNAVKYTPDGGRIGTGCAISGDGGLTITVWDTGPGMTEADRRAALEPFRTGALHEIRANEQHSTGLGLVLVDRMMRLHGGSLRLEEAAGGGLTAVLAFPPSRVQRIYPAAAD